MPGSSWRVEYNTVNNIISDPYSEKTGLKKKGVGEMNEYIIRDQAMIIIMLEN